VTYRQAHRLRQAILDDIDGSEIDCFALFPEYRERIIQADAQNRAILEVDKESEAFKAFAIAPAATRHAHKHIKDLVGLDACHTKSRFRMMLLIATCLDANNQVLPIAWALVLTENTEWWSWLCTFLYDNFPGLKRQEYVFISDREKGIFEGVSATFPKAFPVHCNQHIADNIQVKFGVAARKQFWKIAQAYFKDEFTTALAVLKAENPPAAAYLSNIPTASWAWHARKTCQYGHDTSNISESVNNILRPLRKKQPLRMMDGIWTWVMSLIYERRNRPQKGLLANTPLQLFEERKTRAQRYKVYVSGNGVYQVSFIYI
jgi:hypothetical protein